MTKALTRDSGREYDKTDKIFEKQIIFDYLINHIRFNKNSMDECARNYIEKTIEYFGEVKEGLEHISLFGESFIKRDNLREIFEAISGMKKLFPGLISKTIWKLEDAQEQLERLQESPKEFYETKSAGELLDLCQKFKSVYDSEC